MECRQLVKIACALLVAATSLPAFAEISLNQVVVDFNEKGVRHKDVIVSNRGGNREFVEVTIERVIDPGLPTERREAVKNGLDAGIIISPRKLVIPPGEKKAVRFIDRHSNRNAEHVYRAVVKPVAPPASSEGIKVKVVIAYGVLVIVRPDNPDVNVAGTRNGNTLVLKNEGNTSVMILEGEQCKAADCKQVTGERLYAGGTQTIELPFPQPIQMTYKAGKDHHAKEFR